MLQKLPDDGRNRVVLESLLHRLVWSHRSQDSVCQIVSPAATRADDAVSSAYLTGVVVADWN